MVDPGQLHGEEPIWFDGVEQPTWPALNSSIEADVAIVGGGITGLLTGLLLKRAGLRVVVLEARRIAKGVSGHTTAKVTVAHGSTLQKIADRSVAASYLEANLAGLDLVRELAGELAPDTWHTLPTILLAEQESELSKLKKEVEALERGGVQVTSPADHGLAASQAGAAQVHGQGQLQPYGFLVAVARALDGDGCALHEHSMVRKIESSDGRRVVETDTGRVTADALVLACHLPWLIRGLLFARAFPYMGYAVALEVEPEQVLDATHVSLSSESHAIRFARLGGRHVAVISGAGHKVGQIEQTGDRYRRLVDWGACALGVEPRVVRCWSTHDMSSADHVPYVGRIARTLADTWVATGYGGWGMTNAAAAALTLRELLLDRPAPFDDVYDPRRASHNARGLYELVRENGQVAARFAKDPFEGDSSDELSKLAPGEGRIIRMGGKRVAAARDISGELYVVSPRCTHMGCLVSFNVADRTWDCPCHGSRFGLDGSVLYGPAIDPLRREAVAEETGDERRRFRAERRRPAAAGEGA